MPLFRTVTDDGRRKRVRPRFIGPVQSRGRKSSKGAGGSRIPRPARFHFDSAKYRANVQLAKRMRGISENKYVALVQLNSAGPVSQPVAAPSAKIYKYAMCIGNLPTGAGTVVPLGGTEIPVGLAGFQRVGDSVYLQSITQNLRIEAFANADKPNAPLMEFRVIQVKGRRAVMPSGLQSTLDSNLFLDSNSNAWGTSDTAKYAMDYFSSLVNTRNWVVYHDKKFILSAPDQPAGTSYNGHYPTMKSLLLKYPLWAKTKYDNVTNDPKDIDTTFYTVIFAREVGGTLLTPENFNVSSRGTMTFKDM